MASSICPQRFCEGEDETVRLKGNIYSCGECLTGGPKNVVKLMER